MTYSLGVIPARGGSRGIPKKNIHPLGGRPLIAYTITAAERSGVIDRLVVSTDDDEIARVARELGAEVVTRPTELATDDARTEGTLIHALEGTKQAGTEPDIVVTLEPTSPLRRPATIAACVEALESSSFDAYFAVVETSSLVGTISDSGEFAYLVPGQPRRRQEREPLYREAGVVYATRVEALVSSGSVLGRSAGAIVVDAVEGLDINDPTDLVVAEALIRHRPNG